MISYSFIFTFTLLVAGVKGQTDNDKELEVINVIFKTIYSTTNVLDNAHFQLGEIIKKRKHKVENLETHKSSLENNIDDLRRQKETLETEKLSLLNDITILKRKKETKEKDIEHLETKKSSLETNIGTLDEKKETKEKDIGKLETKKSSLETNITSLEGKKKTKEKDIENLETKQSSLKTDIDTLEGKKKTKERDIEEQKTEQLSLKTEIFTLKSEKDGYKEENNALILKNKNLNKQNYEICITEYCSLINSRYFYLKIVVAVFIVILCIQYFRTNSQQKQKINKMEKQQVYKTIPQNNYDGFSSDDEHVTPSEIKIKTQHKRTENQTDIGPYLENILKQIRVKEDLQSIYESIVEGSKEDLICWNVIKNVLIVAKIRMEKTRSEKNLPAISLEYHHGEVSIDSRTSEKLKTFKDNESFLHTLINDAFSLLPDPNV